MDVDSVYRVFQDWFRPRRIRRTILRSGITSETTVLDVGGLEDFWEYSPVRPRLTLLNTEPIPITRDDLRQVVGDGCRLPFGDRAFDFVFSNSVIEHVPDHGAFAREIARVGKKFYVQTPNKWFPVEPHMMAPLIHFFSVKWQKKLIRHFTLWGLVAKPDEKDIDFFLTTTHLLGAREMAGLFPTAVLERERFLGMTKSLSMWSR